MDLLFPALDYCALTKAAAVRLCVGKERLQALHQSPEYSGLQTVTSPSVYTSCATVLLLTGVPVWVMNHTDTLLKEQRTCHPSHCTFQSEHSGSSAPRGPDGLTLRAPGRPHQRGFSPRPRGRFSSVIFLFFNVLIPVVKGNPKWRPQSEHSPKPSLSHKTDTEKAS